MAAIFERGSREKDVTSLLNCYQKRYFSRFRIFNFHFKIAVRLHLRLHQFPCCVPVGIRVVPVNDAPTLAPIANPNAILVDSALQTVNLAGISAGPNESQGLTVTAISSNPGLIPNPTITYSSPNGPWKSSLYASSRSLRNCHYYCDCQGQRWNYQWGR